MPVHLHGKTRLLMESTGAVAMLTAFCLAFGILHAAFVAV